MSNLILSYRHWIFISVWKISLIVALFVTGCSSPPPTTETVLSTPSSIPNRTASPSPTMPIQTETATITATGTATIRPTSTAPLTPTPTWTTTLPPTLSAIEREAYVKELLRTNAGCDLPCWWGIIPGENQWADIERFLERMGVNSGGYSEPFGRITHYTGFDFVSSNVQNRIGFSEISGLVDYILVTAFGYLDVTAFQEAWQTYAPLEIIQKYGKPSRVWLNSSYSYDTPYSGYGLWLFYDQSGFLITYAGSIGPKKPIYHICPRFEGDYIEEVNLYLQSAESEKPLENLTYYYSSPENREYFQPIEKAGISIDEFYNAFLQEEQPCFDVPGNIFP